ncbi:MAG: hypothetical protein R3F34_18195 [Planctomycetota bacterium]
MTEGTYHESEPRQPRSSSAVTGIVVAAVGCLGCLGVVVAAFLFLGVGAFRLFNDAEPAASEFVDELDDGRFDEARDRTTGVAAKNFDVAVARWLTQVESLGEEEGRSTPGMHMHTGNDGTTARISYASHRERGDATINLVLRQVDDAWLVEGLAIGVVPGSSAPVIGEQEGEDGR